MDLGAKGVPTDGDVEQVQRELLAIFDFVGEHDHPHACSPDRHSLVGSLLDCLIEACVLHEEPDGRGFASGND